MSGHSPTLVGHRLSRSQRLDWRLVLASLGALLILASYFLPMFPNRITRATTRFSEGTTITKHFPVLISGQHFCQDKLPLNEDPLDVWIEIAPVAEHNGSGWGWLLQIVSQRASLLQFFSLFFCLLLPAVAATVILVLAIVAWRSNHGLPERLIPLSIQLALLSTLALLLSWLHQVDFSIQIFDLQPSALVPGIGFWGALLGALLALIAAYGLRNQTERDVLTWWALVFCVALGAWLLIRGRPYPFLEIWNFISDGIVVTLRIVGTSFGFILLVSLLGGLGRISRSPIIYGISSLYVEIIRGIPLLVQLLFIWFALPQVFDTIGESLKALSPSLAQVGDGLIALRLSPLTAAVLGLTICYGAYGSEIFRAGISSIHRGQMEAARSLGMNYLQAMRYVILPQAIRVILPPVGNEFVALLKDSTLVSVLAVSDLTRRGREYMARTFLSIDTWILVALCYLVLTLFSSRVVEFIESKTKFEH